ncbi:MAG: methyltransferase domain-containing protein [Bacteroidetes bacterium]|nr:methyltransferase domain-containing protein [Bacteroidota bacterium]
MQAEVLIPHNSAYRKIINYFKSIHFINVFVKKINACRKVEINCILSGASLKKSDNVLDIGSGDGYWTNYFSKKCGTIVGIEPYQEHLRIAQNKYTGIKFVAESAEALSFKSESFDKVISVCVFEHLYNDVTAFEEMYRVLKPGGILAATVDSLNSKYISDDYKKKHIQDCYCAQLYDVDGIIMKLEKTGFKNVQANYIIGSRFGILYEKLSEKFGIFAYLTLLPLYPVILFLESNFKQSGYKIFVTAEK